MKLPRACWTSLPCYAMLELMAGQVRVINIVGENHFEKASRIRVACRGLILKDDKILLSFETKNNQYMIPGGGREAGESEQECCKRELAEETGLLVAVSEPVLHIHEFYGAWDFKTVYFICRINGETERHLTAREQQAGMEARWVPIQDAVALFSTYNDYTKSDEMRCGMYLREYTALKAILPACSASSFSSFCM